MERWILLLRSLPIVAITASVFAFAFWRSRRQLTRRERLLAGGLLASIVIAPAICVWFVFPIEHVRKLNTSTGCSGKK